MSDMDMNVAKEEVTTSTEETTEAGATEATDAEGTETNDEAAAA